MSTLTASPGGAGLFARSWGVLVFRGVLAIILGILAFVWPAVTLTAIVLAFGFYALVEGIAALIGAIRGHTFREDRWLLWLEAVIGIGVGLLTLRTPAITALVLIFYMAIWAFATGVIRIVEGIRLRHEITGEFWLIIGGIASVVFALLVMVRPLAGALAFIGVIGIYALILGITEVVAAFRLRQLRTHGPQIWDPMRRRMA